MLIDNQKEILHALKQDSRFAFKDKGQYLSQGKCPECGKKELFVKKSEPWRVSCNRSNNCGYTESTRDIYPELFNNYSERFPATKTNKNATADAYLAHNRQFPIEEIKGWYSQGSLTKHNTRESVNTVRFNLNDNGTLYWERLIDLFKDDPQRINFGGDRRNIDGEWKLVDPLKGKWWMPPTQEIKDGDHILWVEGIFHCLALHFEGHKAVASLAAGYFPSTAIEPYLNKNITWILALDDDKAGRTHMLKHFRKLKNMGEKVKILLSGTDKDWDDLYRLKKITEDFLLDAEYRGFMFTAKNVMWKAYYYYCWKRNPRTVISFDNRLYSIKVDSPALYKLLNGKDLSPGFGFEDFGQTVTIRPISNFLPELLYAERDDILDEKYYVFRVLYASNNPQSLIQLEGTNIDTPASFHKAMITKGYGTFSGSPQDMSVLHESWLNNKIKEIQSIPFVGYHPDTATYVYQDFAYHNGKRLPLNEEGYFETKDGGIKSSFKGFKIYQGEFHNEWLDNFIKAFSYQGLTALSFWLGSLFVQQIRSKQKSFPFLEVTGEPGAGKTTLIEFLWTLLGRHETEGFDAMKSTPAGRRRAFTQSSNMPLVLIESDRGDEPDAIKKKAFDFDELKPMFNGRAVGTLGVAKRGNDTEEPLFQGALVFAQNAEVDGSNALISRIIHCHCTTEHHSTETRKIARWFEQQSVETMAGFLEQVLKQETTILKTIYNAYTATEADFIKRGGILGTNQRLIHNHAQISACATALKHIFPSLTDKTLKGLNDYLYERALSRQDRLTDDHPLVSQFWDIYEYLNMQRDPEAHAGTAMIETLNHSLNKPVIAINLNHFQEVCRQHGQEMIDLKRLKRLLPQSRRHRFIEATKVKSAIYGKTMHCWIFQ